MSAHLSPYLFSKLTSSITGFNFKEAGYEEFIKAFHTHTRFVAKEFIDNYQKRNNSSLEDRFQMNKENSENVDAEVQQPIVSPGAQNIIEDELSKEKKRADEYFKRLQYLQADFENYRKRVEKERQNERKLGTIQLLSELLTIVDELDLALQAAKKSENKEQIVKGLEVLYSKFMALLNKQGVESIQALGEVFDPSFHEVVGQVPVDEPRVGRVVEEVRKGFIFDGKVLRPSAVKIGIRGGNST